jgi:hypothetical protein
MRYTTDTGYPFDTDNRAYRRFVGLLGEHFDVVGWDNADTGRPTLTTLIDIASGDTFTIAYLDSLEVRAPHALLVFTVDGELSAHGPFDGEIAAASHAPYLAMTDASVAATRPMPLHHPDQPALPDDAWLPVPAELAHAARPAITDARATALVLLDRDRTLLTVIGPFADHAATDTWQPTANLDRTVDRLIVALHPAPTAAGTE